MQEATTRREVLKMGGGLASVAGIAGTAGCITLAQQIGGNPVKVSSKRFTEQEILGYMAYEMLANNTELNVEDQIGLGGTTTNFRAVNSGEVQAYLEYTGTAWLTLPPQHTKIISNPDKIYRKVKREFKRVHNLVFMERAPLNNTYVLLANPDWAKKTGVKSISGLAEYFKNANENIRIVMNAEFQSRPDGWPGLVKKYGLKKFQNKFNIRNIGSGLLYQVLGTGNADVGVGFNTDPRILKFNLRVLNDNKGFFPAYNPAPMVNGDALEQHPSIETPLDKVGNGLTTEKIRELNRRVSIDQENAQVVARDSLQNRGLI
jgi:glycine betaine/choline ABC-type transport system substrate-binding protein